MKKKTSRKRDAVKRPYVGPRVTVLHPRTDQAAELANAINGGPPAKVEEIVSGVDSAPPKPSKKRA